MSHSFDDHDGYDIHSTFPLLYLAEVSNWKATNYISQTPLKLGFGV